MSRLISLKPIFSEKAFQLSKQNVYMFEVPKDAAKLEILASVIAQFNVKVNDVRCSNVNGKKRRTWQKRSGWKVGQRADTRRAYVTLKEGSRLPFFEEENSRERGEKKPVKNTKKALEKETA